MYQHKSLIKSLEKEGVKLNDLLQIFPASGHKKEVPIKWMKFDIVSESYTPKDLALSHIILPRFSFERFHYQFEYESLMGVSLLKLKKVEGSPFILNGCLCSEAYLEKGDRIFIGDHKLIFKDSPFDHIQKINIDQRILKSHFPLLIWGETGTGKTTLAKRVHEESLSVGAFVALNLSSFNENLIESELFGHKKGAFTGALIDKIGAIELAKNGTLFLDEIDSLSWQIQTKLLTFLDQKIYRTVGGHEEKKVNTRFIFASGKNLETLIKNGKMREDFYYRLNSGFNLHLQSLRDQPEQIEKICREFSQKFDIKISAKLITFYQSLPWPGNIRQLDSHLNKKRIYAQDKRIDFDTLDESLICQSQNLLKIEPEVLTMNDMKKEYFKKVYSLCDSNPHLTAKKLRISQKVVKDFLESAS